MPALEDLIALFRKNCTGKPGGFANVTLAKDCAAVEVEKRIELQILRAEVELSGRVRRLWSVPNSVAWVLLILGIPFFALPTLYIFLKLLFEGKKARILFLGEIEELLKTLSTESVSEEDDPKPAQPRQFSQIATGSLDLRSSIALLCILTYMIMSFMLWTVHSNSLFEKKGIEEGTLRCSDGTLYGQCSKDKPMYCSHGRIIHNSAECGCFFGTLPYGKTCYVACPGTVSDYCNSPLKGVSCSNGTALMSDDMCV